MDIEIRRLGPDDEHAVHAAAALFDGAPDPDATRRFLREPTHHLLIAYDADARPLGFITGVQTTHPDKGTEMFLYELGVDEPARRRGVGSALVEALLALTRERGCYGMWVATEPTNDAAIATYRRTGGRASEDDTLVFGWQGFARPEQGPARSRGR